MTDQEDGKMEWQPIETAPHDGTPILAECNDGGTKYLASVAFWNADMLAAACGSGCPHEYEDYWSHTESDFCCEPIRWLSGFRMPEGVEVEGNPRETTPHAGKEA